MSRKVNSKKTQKSKLRWPLLPLILDKIIFLLYLVSLSVPNLVVSGRKFADDLHIMKWVVVLFPFFVVMLIVGVSLLFDRDKTKKFSIDIFGISLGILLLFCASQYFFVKISSESGFFQELFCFASVWLFYILASAHFPKISFNPILWASNINSAISVLIAELQTRGIYNLAFLKNTAFEFLMPLRRYIWRGFIGPDVNYMGNVGQHNMLGLWLAICTINAAYLFFINTKSKKFFSAFMALLFMSINILGLLSGNSRSGLLSMIIGLFMLGLIFVLRLGKVYKKYLAVIAVVFAIAAAGLVLTNSQGLNWMIGKVKNIEQYKTVAGRAGLWARSFDMLKLYPLGVGIGQYKWHFLEAQRERFKADPSDRFRYTFWAHNEFIQWFCETGLVGGVIFMALLIFWLYKFIRLLITRKEISEITAWGCAIVFVFLCDALWTRPFHRIEDLVWLSVAFAIANHEILENYNFTFYKKALKSLGLIFISSAFLGTAYLSGGMYGNILLRRAMNLHDRDLQKAINLCEEASKYPIAQEKARHHFAIYSLELCERNNDLDKGERYLNLLWESFCREPDPNDFNSIVIWAQRYQNEEILQKFITYHKPGIFSLETTQATDPEGEVIDIITVRNNLLESHD